MQIMFTPAEEGTSVPDPTTPRVTVIEHQPDASLDLFTGWLMPFVDVEVVRPFLGDPVPERAAGGLIVLGGEMNAYDDERYPWLADTKNLLRDAIAHSVPTLGICLGAQLLAVANGGTVEVSDARGEENGIVAVSIKHDDALLADLPTTFSAYAMHGDGVIELGQGGVTLASGDRYHQQVFRIGECAWGLQFHPEVSVNGFKGWVEKHYEAAVEPDPVERERLIREAVDARLTVIPFAHTIANNFAALVEQHAQPQG